MFHFIRIESIRFFVLFFPSLALTLFRVSFYFVLLDIRCLSHSVRCYPFVCVPLVFDFISLELTVFYPVLFHLLCLCDSSVARIIVLYFSRLSQMSVSGRFISLSPSPFVRATSFISVFLAVSLRLSSFRRCSTLFG